MRRYVFTAIAIGLSLEIAVSAFAAPPAVKPLVFQRIYTDGKDVLLVRHVPIPGKKEEIQYTVKVPVNTPSGIQYVDEVRTRVQQVTKEERFPATRDHYFTTIDGTKIPKEKLVTQIPKAGKPVISLIGKDPLPAEWKELLRNDAVIIRFDPPPFDDEQE